METLKAKSMAAFCFLLIAAFWISESEAQYYSSQSNDRPYISVSGEAEVKVIPDRALIILGVETIDSSMTTAKENNDKHIEKITAVAGDFNLKKTDIQTDYLSVLPKYERINNKDVFMGHSVRRQLVLTLNDISRFDDLLSAVISAGVSQVQGVQFVTTELRLHRDKARAMAIKAAADKARDLASGLGQNIGKALNIREGNSRSHSWYGGWNDSFRRRSPSYPASQNVMETGNGEDISIALGKISVTASVNVTFELL